VSERSNKQKTKEEKDNTNGKKENLLLLLLKRLQKKGRGKRNEVDQKTKMCVGFKFSRISFVTSNILIFTIHFPSPQTKL
jgi:hypothetical protein